MKKAVTKISMLARHGDRHLDIPGRPVPIPQQLDARGREAVRHL